MRKIILLSIHFYQRANPLAGLTPFLTNCRFYPTCSEYTYLEVERYGTIKGLFLGFKRILRCHPLTKGGYDPIELTN